jgi:hypothetical protein
MFLYVLHLIACSFWLLATHEGFGTDGWVPPASLAIRDIPEQYVS